MFLHWTAALTSFLLYACKSLFLTIPLTEICLRDILSTSHKKESYSLLKGGILMRSAYSVGCCFRLPRSICAPSVVYKYKIGAGACMVAWLQERDCCDTFQHTKCVVLAYERSCGKRILLEVPDHMLSEERECGTSSNLVEAPLPTPCWLREHKISTTDVSSLIIMQWEWSQMVLTLEGIGSQWEADTWFGVLSAWVLLFSLKSRSCRDAMVEWHLRWFRMVETSRSLPAVIVSPQYQ